MSPQIPRTASGPIMEVGLLTRPEGPVADRDLLLYALTCMLLVVLPVQELKSFCQALPLPPKLRRERMNPMGRSKLQRWIDQRWYQTNMRAVVYKLLGANSCLGEFRQQVVDRGAIAKLVTQSIPWLMLAWSAADSPDPDAETAVRELFGAEKWDSAYAQVRADLTERVWRLLTRPDLEQADRLKTQEEVLTALHADLAKARAENDRLRKDLAVVRTETATKLKRSGEQIASLRKHLSEAEAQVAELRTVLTEERAFWAEWATTRAGAGLDLSGRGPERPLTGKRIAVLGGDPIQDGVRQFLAALGGTVTCYSGVNKLNQLWHLGKPDLAVIITTYLSHSADAMFRNALAGWTVPIVWVNSKGLGSVRRAIHRHLKHMPATG